MSIPTSPGPFASIAFVGILCIKKVFLQSRNIPGNSSPSPSSEWGADSPAELTILNPTGISWRPAVTVSSTFLMTAGRSKNSTILTSAPAPAAFAAAPRALLVGVGLPHQRPDRCDRRGPRAAACSRLEEPGGQAPRPGRRTAVHGWSRDHAVGPDRGAEPRLVISPGPGRRSRRACGAWTVRRLATGVLAPHAGPPVLPAPAVHHRDSRGGPGHVRAAWVAVPADSVPAVPARLHAAGWAAPAADRRWDRARRAAVRRGRPGVRPW
jgi:hypothetical protein